MLHVVDDVSTERAVLVKVDLLRALYCPFRVDKCDFVNAVEIATSHMKRAALHMSEWFWSEAAIEYGELLPKWRMWGVRVVVVVASE
mmetsp:Transcript_5628/g.15756  ORF Transcript_5628/g.15756 Transcript_5628/m.15756 type:complete len:87 (+) Transcript_5628:761-1021(+)